MPAQELTMSLKWEKLSPSEFQQLQDYIQGNFPPLICIYKVIIVTLDVIQELHMPKKMKEFCVKRA